MLLTAGPSFDESADLARISPTEFLISSLRELAAGSVQLPDHPCEESVHTASRVLAAHWLELIKAERDEEDRKEQAKLLQLQQAVGNKQAELNEKVGDLQRHLQPDTNRRRR